MLGNVLSTGMLLSEEKNTTLANQLLSSTNGKKYFIMMSSLFNVIGLFDLNNELLVVLTNCIISENKVCKIEKPQYLTNCV